MEPEGIEQLGESTGGNTGQKPYRGPDKDVPEPTSVGRIGDYPLTPAARTLLFQESVPPGMYNEVNLRLVNFAEELGRQITTGDYEEKGKALVMSTIEQERIQAKLVAEIPGSQVTDVVTGVEVLHQPRWEGGPATIRIRAITQKGYRATIRNLAGIGSSRVIEKLTKTRSFAEQTLIGRELTLDKHPRRNKNGVKTGEFLALHTSRIPENFRGISYQQVAAWAKNNQK